LQIVDDGSYEQLDLPLYIVENPVFFEVATQEIIVESLVASRSRVDLGVDPRSGRVFMFAAQLSRRAAVRWRAGDAWSYRPGGIRFMARILVSHRRQNILDTRHMLSFKQCLH
jgi:hypothetical protein